LDLSRQKTRPLHPLADEKGQGCVRKKGLRDALTAAAKANPGKRVELWSMG
jgi:hypothetical protein